MKESVAFGTFLKRTRLESGLSARTASDLAGMQPSNFSKLEHGALKPPQDPEKLKALASSVGIQLESETASEFFDLAAAASASIPADLADIISRNEALPLLLRTIGNKRLSPNEIEELVKMARGIK